MKSISRLFLFGALTLVLLTTACAGQQILPTATAQATSTPTITATGTSTITVTLSPTTTMTVSIPVTGPTTAELVCEFCMDAFTQALVIIPAAATFTVLSPTPSASTNADVSCNTVDTFRDKQIVLCRAPSNSSLSVNVCQGDDCHQFTVRLQICPPPTAEPITPTWTATLLPPVVSMTPTLIPPVINPTSTGTAGTPIATATIGSATPTRTVSPTVTP